MAAAVDLNPCIALHQAGQLDDAIACYRQALPQDRAGVQVNRLLGLALFAKGDAAEALTHLRAALDRAPSEPALLNDMGNVLRALGRRPDAVQAFRRAIAANPGFAFAQFNLADGLLEMGRHAEALEVYRTILMRRLDGIDADFHNNLGTCLMALDRPAEALTAFGAALKTDPTHVAAAAHAGLRCSGWAATVNPWPSCATPRAAAAPRPGADHARAGAAEPDRLRPGARGL